ncbi:Phytanoyl-CoA dioxygenase [Pseudopedobacter saltans DSM 12145]|uniref:Phytanoyl-CoA dioxygenase n=1 Tax=Pseudopedobacter saltans (strain ATCC 51119 / DSM 12145 / JCM 21818 / CCUG 39354 / LMG 10337 / NBRC 100064 / NCIMB 13643) TaxID=762903 RepID=F0S9N8_PSESL|nr:phytanoyl-CoA dioxygenase family protein [Pseudopedobacter saltans]ADY51394.1 Phytanoyl-CoA dioxygenase [Pseudopedobacter saltans DSM 12145]
MENRFNYSEATISDFESAMDQFGWVIYENAVEENFINEIINDLEPAYLLRRAIQIQNGIEENMEGTLHHLLEKDNFSMPFLEQKYCDKEMKHFLNGNYILNGFSGVLNFKNFKAYVHNIHRDIRSFTGNFKIAIQMIVPLDDYTLENGATYFLTGSHHIEDKPDEQFFYMNADRAVSKKGSIILFDSNIWHAVGNNNTDNPRRALTLTFTRPFFKPQFDFPRYLGYDFTDYLSPHLKQVIGYNSRISANFQEFYQPPHLRMYQPGQG